MKKRLVQPSFPEEPWTDGSWGGLIALIAVCAVGMTLWFALYPLVALTCTVGGVIACRVLLVLAGSAVEEPEDQPDLNEG